jgi:hypothetical protein
MAAVVRSRSHRNASLRKWLVEEHMLGQKGMAHPAVDGYLIDDWCESQPPHTHTHPSLSPISLESPLSI